MRPYATASTVATLALSSIERALTSSARLMREAAHGVLAGSLAPEERAALSVALYEQRLGRVRSALAGWERAWFEEDLPAPPARILIGGAGDGREARELAASGHRVVAFDPGPRAVERCARALADRGESMRGSYEELARVVLDGTREGALAALADRRFDAVLLGWTSVMHVVDARERARLFATCDRLCPSGPILLTFYPSERARSRGRAFRMGAVWGRALGRARGGVEGARDDEAFGFGCGFLRGWTVGETEELAGLVDRRALWRGDDEGCLRATLVRA